jgi:pterin-4a-carbinolamine dehydratase
MDRGWHRDGDTMVREIVMRDFESALRFLEQVAQAAVDYGGRRPDMAISEFNHVRVVIANPHHIELTEAERRLMDKVDSIVTLAPT